MYEIKPSDAELLRAYRTSTPHTRSLELNRLLNRLRMEPLEGKEVVVCLKPFSEYAIGKMSGKRGVPMQIGGERFSNAPDAQWEVLKRRWAKHSPYPWPDGLD